MKLYFYGLIMLIKKFIFKISTGKCVFDFVKKMGVVYIKFAQMLAMQSHETLFTEDDRKDLANICDQCNPLPFKKVRKIIEKEYGIPLEEKFLAVFEKPIGSASISQVHKGLLNNGGEVAIKIKRPNVDKRIEKDIKRIKRLIHLFGKFFKLNNLIGSDEALDLYLSWIREEVNFKSEKANILKYQEFADTMNALELTNKKLTLPALYEELCTDRIIVMEFIKGKTVNRMADTLENKKRINTSINDYIYVSFYALLHQMPLIFHGDLHMGNLYLDEDDNLGFLDMGLIFTLNESEEKFVLELFLYAYTCNIEKLFDVLLKESTVHGLQDLEKLKKEMEQCCEKFKKNTIPEFFCNMIGIFTKYNVCPPKVLFKLAKCFVPLFGMGNFLHNRENTEHLLKEQIIEYYIQKTTRDIKNTTIKAGSILPNFFIQAMKGNIAKGISQEITTVEDCLNDMHTTFGHFKDLFKVMK